MKLVFYICGITRGQCLKKKMWNYVYFLTYLHIGDSNDFNELEKVVWGNAFKKDISWIPVINDGEEILKMIIKLD